MARKVLGTIAGMIAAIIVIMLVQSVSHLMFPLPEGLSAQDKAGLREHFQSLPTTAFLMVILAYALGSLAGGFVSAMVSKVRYMPALVIGGLLTLGGIANGMMIPQPLWVTIVSLLTFIPSAYLGAKWAKI